MIYSALVGALVALKDAILGSEQHLHQLLDVRDTRVLALWETAHCLVKLSRAHTIPRAISSIIVDRGIGTLTNTAPWIRVLCSEQ
jgi:hypothetical protein